MTERPGRVSVHPTYIELAWSHIATALGFR